MDSNTIAQTLKALYDGFDFLTLVSVGISIFTTTVAKEYMASKDKSLPVYAIRVWAFIISVVLFVLIGVWARRDLRDELFVVNALGSGMAGPIIFFLAKKYLNINLNDIMAGEKEKQDGTF